MPRPFFNRRSSRIAGIAGLLLAVAGCHCGQPRQRPIGEGVRRYFAGRPAYDGAPARTFSLGSYAGYNYRQARPRALAPEPAPPLIGDRAGGAKLGRPLGEEGGRDWDSD